MWHDVPRGVYAQAVCAGDWDERGRCAASVRNRGLAVRREGRGPVVHQLRQDHGEGRARQGAGNRRGRAERASGIEAVAGVVEWVGWHIGRDPILSQVTPGMALACTGAVLGLLGTVQLMSLVANVL